MKPLAGATEFVLVTCFALAPVYGYTDGWCNSAPPSCVFNSDCPTGSFATVEYYNCPVVTDPPYCGIDGFRHQPTYSCPSTTTYTGVCLLGTCLRTFTVSGACQGCGAGDCGSSNPCVIVCTGVSAWVNGSCAGVCGVGSRQQNRTNTPSGCNSGGASLLQCVADPTCAAPVITSFIATPPTILQGNNTVLSWTVSNAATVSLSGVGAVVLPTLSTAPWVTTSFTLTAVNAFGSVSAPLTVTVTPVARCGLGHLCGNAHAQEKASLALSGLAVELRDSRGLRLNNTLTDAGGHYDFAVAPGPYIVVPIPDRLWSASPLSLSLSPDNAVSDGNFTMRGVPAHVSFSGKVGDFVLVTTYSYSGAQPPAVGAGHLSAVWSTVVDNVHGLSLPGGTNYWIKCWKQDSRFIYRPTASKPLNGGSVLWPTDQIAEGCL